MKNVRSEGLKKETIRSTRSYGEWFKISVSVHERQRREARRGPERKVKRSKRGGEDEARSNGQITRNKHIKRPSKEGKTQDEEKKGRLSHQKWKYLS